MKTTAPLPIDDSSTSLKQFSTEIINAEATTESGIEIGLQNLKQVNWLGCILKYLYQIP